MLSKLSMNIINSLTISELDVLRFLDNNREEIQDLSIQKLASQRFVSTATIMRLCKKIGFSGYSELKYYLKEESRKQQIDIETLTFSDLVHKNKETIVETSKLIKEEEVNKIVDAMLKAKNIHFFGKGLNNVVLTYVSKMLMTSGVPNFIYDDTHIAYLAAETMDTDDILFVASLTGNTHQVTRTAQIAKSRSACVVTITDSTVNELSKLGDYPLYFFSDKNLMRPADISSRLPILFILNIIVNVYLTKRNKH